MERDIRETALYLEAEALHRSLRQPGSGQISDAVEVHVSPDGKLAVFTATMVEELRGLPRTRICSVDLATSQVRVLTVGSGTDRLPKFSPDGLHVAFLSDRHKTGDFQLHLLNPKSHSARPAPSVDGWVEYFHWSPDGKRILLGVAGHGADVGGVQGAVTSKQLGDGMPSWMPAVETGDDHSRWRRAWIYDLGADRVYDAGPAANIWEAAWCGNSAIAAVTSDGPGEGLWYSARLQIIDLESGKARGVYNPEYQLGWPAASPSGKTLAIVEAACSDRWWVAGDLHLIDVGTGMRRRVDTNSADITYTEWRSDRHLLLAGHRGFDTIVGIYDSVLDSFTESWISRSTTTSGFYATVSGLNEAGDFVFVAESFTRAPEIALVRNGQFQSVKSFDLGYADQAKAIGAVHPVCWKAPDGLEIQGWVLRPDCKGPHPLIMSVHGGPVWHWRPTWLGRRSVFLLMLLKRGYAAFFPNPRGSSGRGQEFVRHILGDLGGAETDDHLSGLDQLVADGVADPARLGVIGLSHGGFMSSWLVTQDSRFAAAIPVAPVTNHVTERLIGNIPHFVRLFLADNYNDPGGKYFERSPVMHAHKAKTPTLNICGLLDRCTPPEESVQFHNALLENGVRSELVTYPEEGHGIRAFPAAIDYTARVVAWFEEHVGSAT